MKRFLAVFLAAAWLLGAAAAEAAPLTEKDLVLLYAGEEYALLADPAPLLAAMRTRDGAAPDMLEADACQFAGKDREYTGLELVLGTHPAGPGGSDRLETVVILGGPWRTARGVGIGSSREDVIAAYGERFIEDYDQLSYWLGAPNESPALVFQMDLATQTVTGIFFMAHSA